MPTLAQAKERILRKWNWTDSNTSYPVILLGAPGLGKTMLIYQLVAERLIFELSTNFNKQSSNLDKDSEEYKKLKAEFDHKINILNFDDVTDEVLELLSPHCLVLRLAERPIEQLQGVVVPSMSEEKNYARFVMPENLVKLKDSAWGIVFLDELDKASDSKFGAATHILENKVVGDLKLGQGWYVIAAANREEDSFLSNPIPPELRNRCAQIEIEPDLNVWIDWAVKHKVRKDIILFHKFSNGEWLSKYDLKQTYAFPTPRTWTMASRVIDRLEKKLVKEQGMKLDEFNEIVRQELNDFVGRAAQVEFFQYRELYLKFNVLDILDGKDSIKKVDQGSPEERINIINDQCVACFAMADQVSAEMLGKAGDASNLFKFIPNETRLANLVKFIESLAPEIRAIYLKQIYSTRIINILMDSGVADSLIEEMVQYMAS